MHCHQEYVVLYYLIIYCFKDFLLLRWSDQLTWLINPVWHPPPPPRGRSDAPANNLAFLMLRFFLHFSSPTSTHDMKWKWCHIQSRTQASSVGNFYEYIAILNTERGVGRLEWAVQ